MRKDRKEQWKYVFHEFAKLLFYNQMYEFYSSKKNHIVFDTSTETK